MGRCAQSKSGGRLTCGRNKDCGASAKLALSDTVDRTREASPSASLQDVIISASRNIQKLYLVQTIVLSCASEITLLLDRHATK